MNLKFKAYHEELGMSDVFKIGEYPTWGEKTLAYWKDTSRVLQFTGMQDKNRKDIYLGDIIKWIDSDGVERIDEVKYVNSAFILCNFNFHLGCYEGKEMEIVGNIYFVEKEIKENIESLRPFVLGYSEDQGVFLERG